MRFFLIGGAGYLGGRLARHLLSQGHKVSLTTRRSPEALPEHFLSGVSGAAVLQMDPADPEGIREAAQGADIVIHLAFPGQKACQENPAEALRLGQEGIAHALEGLGSLKVPPPFIYVSTFHVYGKNARGVITEETPPEPRIPYGRLKLASETAVQEFQHRANLTALRVRLSNAFGSHLGDPPPLAFTDFCRQAVTQGGITLRSSGKEQRNFITLTDAARGLEFLSERPKEWPADGLIHLGSALQWSVLEAARLVAEEARALTGSKPAVHPGEDSSPAQEPFTFSIERMTALGFKWMNNWKQEISDTLRLAA